MSLDCTCKYMHVLARNFLRASWFLCVFFEFIAPGYTQVVEQNPAPLLFGEQRSGLGSSPIRAEGDDASVGVKLRRLVVVNKIDAEPNRPEWRRREVDLSDAGSFLQDPQVFESLKAFVGEPLSEKLIEELRVSIVAYYRARGRPFMAVDFPPQEVTGGELKVQVVEFRAGRIDTEGNRWTSSDYILDRVRQTSGDKIDATRLTEDLNWLNLNPYRRLGAVFEPGAVPGETDITLRSDERRPWTIYAGYANSGSSSTGLDRVFAGGNVANLPFVDHQMSFLATLNPETLTYGDVIGVGRAPGYASHAFSYFAPVDIAHLLRTKFQLTAGYVESGSVLNRFFNEFSQSWVVTTEAAIPISVSGLRSFEVFAGADIKRQFSETNFGETVILKSNADVGQFRAGIRGAYDFTFGPLVSSGNAEAYAVMSPSSLLASSMDYNYLRGSLKHITRYRNGIGLSVAATGQYAVEDLPDLEKTAIGGSSSVRGYAVNELSGSSGVSGSLELRSPVFTQELRGGVGYSAEAYAFFDAGQVWNERRTPEGIQSIGAGLDFSLGEYLTATLELGHALEATAETNRGQTSIFGTVVLRY